MIDGSMKKEYRRPDNQESQRQHDTQLQKKTSMYNNARHKDKQANALHINKREQLRANIQASSKQLQAKTRLWTYTRTGEPGRTIRCPACWGSDEEWSTLPFGRREDLKV
jgi:hypothetical protein